MRDDMDVNCGLIIDGHSNIEEMGQAIFDLILETASRKKSKSEMLSFGDNEFVPWHMGVSLQSKGSEFRVKKATAIWPSARSEKP
jgi:altronate hydrolase